MGSLTLNFTYLIRIPTLIQKKCPNVPSEVKQEMRQLLDLKKKEKVKKAADIEEMRAELRGTMGGPIDISLMMMTMRRKRRRMYMYPGDMTLDEKAEFRATCRASKASEWNRQQEEEFTRGKIKMGKSLT